MAQQPRHRPHPRRPDVQTRRRPPMRLSDLLEHDVTTVDGRRLGQLHDVRLVQDGPITGIGDATFRLHGIVVGKGGFGTRLGYVTRPGYAPEAETKGPWPI